MKKMMIIAAALFFSMSLAYAASEKAPEPDKNSQVLYKVGSQKSFKVV